MFAKETYVQRRAQLKKTIGSGVLLFLGTILACRLPGCQLSST